MIAAQADWQARRDPRPPSSAESASRPSCPRAPRLPSERMVKFLEKSGFSQNPELHKLGVIAAPDRHDERLLSAVFADPLFVSRGSRALVFKTSEREDGSSVATEVIGEDMDSGDKAADRRNAAAASTAGTPCTSAFKTSASLGRARKRLDACPLDRAPLIELSAFGYRSKIGSSVRNVPQ